MTLIGLLLALLAGLLIFTRWSPLERPSRLPAAAPAQMLERGRQAAEEFRGVQQERMQRLENELPR